METLTEAEVARLLSCLDQKTLPGCRNTAILLLFLDTGLRCSELLGLSMKDLFIEIRCLKVLGKGQKERIVPFGDRTTRALLRYLNLRPDPKGYDNLFLNLDGEPLTENAVKVLFERLSKKAGIPRLHIHLLRHTMATRYLLAGENPFKLQRILGHETLEMTRRYVDMVALQASVKGGQGSPVDSMALRRGRLLK